MGVPLDNQLNNLAAQIDLAVAFSWRDAPKRVLTNTIFLGILTYYGAVEAAKILFPLMLLFESLRFITSRQLRDAKGTVCNFQLASFVFIYCASSFFYCVTGILLLHLPYTTAQIMGVMWIGAVASHAIGANTLIPVISWLTILPIAAAFLVGIGLQPPTIATEFGNWDSHCLGVATFLWVANLAQITVMQGKNRKAFAEARATADQRLEQLEYLSQHDALTGLLNRRAFDEAGLDAFQFNTSVAVMILDLDGFKPINDMYGHAAGDAVLETIARRIEETAGDYPVARLGGDEFGILLPTALDELRLEWLARDLEHTVSEAIEFDGRELVVGTSIGYAVQDATCPSFAALCITADDQMYQAKQNRKRRLTDMVQPRRESR